MQGRRWGAEASSPLVLRRLCHRRLRRSGNGGRGCPQMTTTTAAEATAAAMSLSALALGWSLQNVVLGIILFFYCCQGGRGGEGEGGDWRLRRCARRRRRGQRQSRGWGGAMTVCGDAHAGGGEDNGEAGEIRRGLGGGLTRGATSRGEIRQWVIIERS